MGFSFPPFSRGALHIPLLFLQHIGMHTPSFALHNYPSFSPPRSPLPFRLVHSGPGKSSPLLDSDLSFGLRSGTKQGVETHVFRVDSAKELSTWTHLLVEGCHDAAELIKEVTTGTDAATRLTPGSTSSLFLHSSSAYESKNSVLNDATEVHGLTPTGVTLFSWHRGHVSFGRFTTC